MDQKYCRADGKCTAIIDVTEVACVQHAPPAKPTDPVIELCELLSNHRVYSGLVTIRRATFEPIIAEIAAAKQRRTERIERVRTHLLRITEGDNHDVAGDRSDANAALALLEQEGTNA